MRWPAEWEPHERTIMGWPCRARLWGEHLEAACADYATVANAVAAFEPVTMIANPGADAAGARSALRGDVEVVELPLDDSWLRDSGPIYVTDTDGRARTAVHWRFNAWGKKFPPWERDAAVGGAIAAHLGDPVREVDMVLEGGAVLSDGAGTILTTEQCLLAPNRNPTLSRAQIEATVLAELGGRRMVWLGEGQYEDRDTDGHVDMIAAIVPDGRVLLQTAPAGDPNHERGEDNLARLSAAGLEAVVLEHLPRTTVGGEPVAVSYLNFYIANGAVIVPVCGDAFDPEALARIGGCFPGREVVPVPGATIAFGGGGPHCITQQVPAIVAPDPGAAGPAAD
ncbi:MAG TPA: agmatine deiminase family protein [Solirubrobacteraceae bacterium]|nr:agmatine deiminase family protein [Solirubrobacteraceae bacterium]